MKLQRLLEMVHTLALCDLLPPGNFRVWARANAIRHIRELLEAEVWRRLYVAEGNGSGHFWYSNVEPPR